ncbi:MAG: PAS domain S-box protein [Chitinivibrionales bacterium]
MTSRTTKFFIDAEDQTVLPKTRKIKRLSEHEQFFIYDVHLHRLQLSKENRQLREVQASLESSHRRYHDFYLNAPTAFLTISEDGTVSDANNTAARLLQTDRAEIVGCNIITFCVPADRQNFHAHIKRVFEEKRPLTCQITMEKKGGQRVCIHTESVARYVNDRWEVHSTMLDIGDRVKIENALRQSEQKYREIVETTLEGVWIFDSRLRVSYVNPRLSTLLGYSVTELIGKHLFDFIDVQERQFLQKHHYDRRQRGVREKRLLKKDKTWIWVLESLNPLIHQDGYYLGRLGMLTDISQQKRVEMELKKAQTQLEQKIQMQSTDLKSAELSLREQTTHRVRAEAELTRRQQALEAVYAIAIAHQGTPSAILERVVTSVSDVLAVPYCAIGIADGRQFSLYVERCDGQIKTVEALPAASGFCCILQEHDSVLNIRRGSSRWENISILDSSPYNTFLGMPITGPTGEVLGSMCVLDTEDRIFTRSDYKFIEIFAGYIANSILQEQMQNQLLHSQEMRMLGQLTSGVAHEVRNPLNAIVAITEALFQDIGGDSQYAPYLQHVRSQVERLSALMQDLLDLGKPERQFNLATIPVRTVIDSSIDSWRQSSPHKHRCVRAIFPETIDTCFIKADSLKIQQVFSNLIDNACHHSDISTRILIVVMAPENGHIRIRVVDNGCGVPPEKLTRLFEPFYTTRKGGTGLGLSVVRHIVAVHGGRLTIANNDPAPGLTVEISFPALAQ